MQILLLVITSSQFSGAQRELVDTSCPGTDVIEGERAHGTVRSDRRNNIPDEAEIRWIDSVES
jgi:hypothetical protein